MTDFTIVYKRFYSKITDDMYMELDEAETDALLEELLINAIPWFEFPRVNLENYDLLRQRFKVDLSNEEINILATYMVVGWIDQQLASIELIRMKYTGSDFKMTSQANHMSKLMALKKEYLQNGFHLQRVYKRRKVDGSGNVKSTFGSIMASSVRRGVVSSSSSSSNSGNNNNNNNNNNDNNDNSGGGSGSGNESWEDMESIFPPSSDEGGWEDMGPADPVPPEDSGWEDV